MKDFNIHNNKNYTIMSNYHFQEKNMSLKAKGLLSLMLSLPENWDYSIRGLTTLSKDGRDAVMGALQELEEFGYLIRTIKKGSDGKFKGYLYDIYEMPQKPRNIPYTENPDTANPNTENPTQYNTKEIKNENNKKDKLINDKSREARACEDESSMSFKNGELIDEENDEKNNTMQTHRKNPTKYPSNDTSHEARTEMREMVSERGLDPFTYQHMHHLVQKLYYDKVFTPEECLALSDKLNELDKEHWYMTVAKAFSYSLDKSKSKKIKNRVGYLLKIIEKNVEQIEYNESGEPERKVDELFKTLENIKNGKLATSS